MNMENPLEKIYQPETAQETTPKYSAPAHSERLHIAALETESYEDASAALSSVEELINFRAKLRNMPFGSFYEVAEAATNLNKSPLSAEEKNKQFGFLVEIMEQRAAQFSPRVADLYLAILADIKGEPYEAKFDLTREKMNDLKQSGDLRVLISGDISWELKLNRVETRLVDYLSGMRALDKREGKEMDDDIRQWREEELKKAPARPLERRNESKPGVDPMERLKEGERAPVIWSIYPAWGGYYKEQSFAQWDNARNVWYENNYEYSDAATVALAGNQDPKNGPIDITMSAKALAGQWVALPVPYTHSLHKIEAGGRNYQVQQDQNGDLVIFLEGAGEVEIKVMLASYPEKKLKSEPTKVRVPDMLAEFSEETNNKIEEIKNKKRGNVARAQALASYVRSRVKYLAPKDRAESERYNTAYNTHPKGFAGAVDEIKQADCDVANTYFAALCAKLKIPVKHCVGHSVKGKDKEGAASIHSGTGHGWSEVWDEIKKEWMRIDATPAGDPNLEEDEKPEGESAPGDYGEQEAARPTDEQLEDLRQKLSEHKEKLSYTKEERQLAQAAGVELKEARQIVKEINEAEQTRLPNGELVVDALAKLFNAIVESRKTVGPTYDGPVRRREGGEHIENIVRHKIGMLAGDTDPLSREKLSQETKQEKIIGGFDLYIIGDKSGSMQNTALGERLWQMQRRAECLIFSALHRFERNIERSGLQKDNALSVRTQGVSFRGNTPAEIDLDKPLSPNFTAQDKVKLWHSLTEQGSGNGDVAALSIIYNQIKEEAEEIEKQGAKDNRLRLVVACSDGGPDSPEGVRELAEKIGRLNAVVVGVGLTETAATVPIIYDTPYSRGDIARDINDLPALVAKHLVLEAVKLFPEKARESAKQIIESSIAKFKNF